MKAPEPAKPTGPVTPVAPVEEKPVVEKPVDPVEVVRASWATVREEVSRRNKVAGIMLAEARVLGLREDTLVLGHNTGALAERLNAESNNTVVAKVVSEHTRRELKVQCVIGTDPAAAGFSPTPAKQETWKPHPPVAQPEPAEAPEEPESPAPTWGRPRDSGSDTTPPTPAPAPEAPAPTWGKPRDLGGDSTPPAPEAPAPTWGRPRDLGSDATPQQPTPAPAPAQPEPEKPSWQQIVERGRANAARQAAERAARPAFDDGVPLPPEPMDDPEMVPPEDHAPAPQPTQPTRQDAPSRREEEDEMVEAAQEPGTYDRRDATTIAVELLEQELGARRL